MAGRAEGGGSTAEPTFDAGAFARSLEQRLPTRWIGWRLRLLVAAALVGCLTIFSVVRLLATSPWLDTNWQTTASSQLSLQQAADPGLDTLAGRTLTVAEDTSGRRFTVDALAIQRSPRWQVEDDLRQQQVAQQERLASAFAAGRVVLHFTDGSRVEVATPPRGLAGIGLLFWPLAALALLLMLLGAVVVLARPRITNALFFVMALCQAGNLLFIGIAATPGIGLPAGAASHEMLLRMAFDGITAAAAVHAFALHPRRLAGARWIAAAAWAVAVLVIGLAHADALVQLWWWAQGLALGLGVASLVLLSLSYRIEPNPFAALMRRFGAIAAGTLALVTLAAASAAGQPV